MRGSTPAEVKNRVIILLPTNQHQCRTFALCYVLYPVSAALTSSFWMDSFCTSYNRIKTRSNRIKPAQTKLNQTEKKRNLLRTRLKAVLPLEARRGTIMKPGFWA